MTRKEAINVFKGFKFLPREQKAVDMAIEALELVTSYEGTINKLTEALNQQKEGHWINYHTTCDKCGWQMFDDEVGSPNMVFFKFCPNCGAHMKGGE